MKKLFQILLVLSLFGMIIQVMYVLFSETYEMKYQIKEKEKAFVIKEKYTSQKKEENHYSFTINDTFSFRIYKTFYKNSKLIKSIKYYEDKEYACMYPIFKVQKINMDVLCKQNGKQFYYHTIKGKNKNLDQFVTKLAKYDEAQFLDQKEQKKEREFVTLYTDNLQKNHFVALQSYKGIYMIGSKKEDSLIENKLYNNDIYEPIITGSTEKYYITADYNGKYSFRNFYIVDMITGNKKEINSSYEISYDSYIQGTTGYDIYLLDKEKQRQYKIDVKKKKVSLVGTTGKGIRFYNGKSFVKEDMNKAVKQNIYFSKQESIYQNKEYDKIERVGTEKSGFYYLYKKVGGKTKVSRTNIDNTDIITDLFETSSIENVFYDKDYIYFLDGRELKYYSDETGLRTLAIHSELTFNKYVKYFVYIK